jgi:4-amino-4-deoxy-L-arabinose transferase-like glycosyltransferase
MVPETQTSAAALPNGRLPSGEAQRRNFRIVLLLALVTFAEAVTLLWKTGNAPIADGLGWVFQLITSNLLTHHVYSASLRPPYEQTVYLTPGYPLFLGGIEAMTGPSTLCVRAAQFLLLWLTGGFVYTLAQRFTSRRAAIIAALLTVTYLPLLVFALRYLTEILSTFLVVLSITLLVELQRRRTRAYSLALVLGGVLSFSALVRPAMICLVPVAALALWRHHPDGEADPPRGGRRVQLGRSLLLIAGAGIVLLPWTIRNWFVTREFVPLSANSGISLVVSAQQYAGTTPLVLPPNLANRYPPSNVRRLIVGCPQASRNGGIDCLKTMGLTTPQIQVLYDRGYTTDALAAFRRLPVATIVSHLPARVMMLWSSADSPSYAPRFHRTIELQHTLLAVLALVGLLMSLHRLREQWPLWVVPVFLTLLHLVFHVEARYSIPARPFLLIYAAIALDALMAKVSRATVKDTPAEL